MNFEYTDWTRDRFIVQLSYSSMALCAVAGAVSLVASALLRDTQYLVFGLISLPVGIISIFYMKDYQSLLEELNDRDEIAEMAEKVSQSGSDISTTTSRLEQELQSIKMAKDSLEKQIQILTETNGRLTEHLEVMNKVGGKLTQTHADFSKDFEALRDLEEVMQSKFIKMKELLEQERMKDEDELSAIDQRAQTMQERFQKISSIYERTFLLTDIKDQLISLNFSNPEKFESIITTIPSLKKIITTK